MMGAALLRCSSVAIQGSVTSTRCVCGWVGVRVGASVSVSAVLCNTRISDINEVCVYGCGCGWVGAGEGAGVGAGTGVGVGAVFVFG
jgi:hypothetical protein